MLRFCPPQESAYTINSLTGADMFSPIYLFKSKPTSRVPFDASVSVQTLKIAALYRLT